MKNLKKSFFLIIFLFVTNKSFAKIESTIVLKIENEIISNYEVKNKILTSLIMNGQEINQKNIDNNTNIDNNSNNSDKKNQNKHNNF